MIWDYFFYRICDLLLSSNR